MRVAVGPVRRHEPPRRDLAAELVVADVEVLEPDVHERLGHPPRDPVVAQVQEPQVVREAHPRHVELELVPRQVDLGGRARDAARVSCNGE